MTQEPAGGPTAPDDDVNRLRIALARIARGVDRQVTGDGMTRTQLSLLGTLARSKTAGMGELADLEGLNPTMLSRVVGKLEAAGLLRRTPDPNDRRAVVVEITAAGARLQERLRKQRTKLFVERLARLDAAEHDGLLAAIPALEALAATLLSARTPEPAQAGAGR